MILFALNARSHKSSISPCCRLHFQFKCQRGWNNCLWQISNIRYEFSSFDFQGKMQIMSNFSLLSKIWEFLLISLLMSFNSHLDYKDTSIVLRLYNVTERTPRKLPKLFDSLFSQFLSEDFPVFHEKARVFWDAQHVNENVVF